MLSSQEVFLFGGCSYWGEEGLFTPGRVMKRAQVWWKLSLQGVGDVSFPLPQEYVAFFLEAKRKRLK